MFLAGFPAADVRGQETVELLVADDHSVKEEVIADDQARILEYEKLNKHLGGDSIRNCNGYACIGWVEDTYPDGTLKHRGYYDQGQLLIYRNYHPDGSLERDFKVTDNTRAVMRTYHPNGQMRSEVKYRDGEAYAYEDHYLDGTLRYVEEKHKSEPYYLRMDLFAADGTPISTLELVDKRNKEFLQREYHPNGTVSLEGRSRYVPSRYDSMRVGKWVHFDAQGKPVKEESYTEGRVASVRDL